VLAFTYNNCCGTGTSVIANNKGNVPLAASTYRGDAGCIFTERMRIRRITQESRVVSAGPKLGVGQSGSCPSRQNQGALKPH
jgi:hypothetical protein